MGFYSRVFLVFLMKESKKRRRKQPGKLMAKSRSQQVNLPGARPLMKHLPYTVQLLLPQFSLIRDFGKQNTRGNVSKIFVSLACY